MLRGVGLVSGAVRLVRTMPRPPWPPPHTHTSRLAWLAPAVPCDVSCFHCLILSVYTHLFLPPPHTHTKLFLPTSVPLPASPHTHAQLFLPPLPPPNNNTNRG